MSLIAIENPLHAVFGLIYLKSISEALKGKTGLSL